MKKRSWVRISTGIRTNYKLAQLPTDAVRWTWFLAVCEGKLQDVEGAWFNWTHFLACLPGRRPSHAVKLREAGLVLVHPETGAVTLSGWERWQTDRGDPGGKDPRPAPWFRVDVGSPRHRKVTGLTTDGTRWTWLTVLAEGKLQNPQGQWESYQHFRGCLCGKPPTQLLQLFNSGLLDNQESHTVEVHNWSRFQSEPPRSGAERQRLYRRRKALRDSGVQLLIGPRKVWGSKLPGVTRGDAGVTNG